MLYKSRTAQHGKHMLRKMENQVRIQQGQQQPWPNAVVIVRKFEHIWQSAKVNRTVAEGLIARLCPSLFSPVSAGEASEKWAEQIPIANTSNSLLSDKAIRSKMGFCIWNAATMTPWQQNNSTGGRGAGRGIKVSRTVQGHVELHNFVYTKRISTRAL